MTKLSSFIITMLTALLLLPVVGLAAPADAPKLRVGYYLMDGYQELSANGRYGGYIYDYYKQLQKYTGWQYEFVPVNFGTGLAMLERGELDIMSAELADKTIVQSVLWNDYEIGSLRNKLFARQSDNAMYYDEASVFDGLRVGVLNGASTRQLDEYCHSNNITLQKIPYPSIEALELALEHGDVRLIYAGAPTIHADVKLVKQFDESPLGFMITSKRPELNEQLKAAVAQIEVNNPNFAGELTKRQLTRRDKKNVAFSRSEVEYINKRPEVYVILNPSWRPISYFDANTQQFKGIIVDIFELMAEYNGLNFHFCTGDEFNKLAAQKPEVIMNLLAVLVDDNNWADQNDVYMSDWLIDASVVRVGKKVPMERAEPKIALPRGYYVSWQLSQTIPPEQIIYYDTIDECFAAILNDEADFTYVNDVVARYYLSMLKYSKLFIFSGSELKENLAAAVFRGGSPELLSIVNKSLLNISAAEINDIMLRNSAADDEKISVVGLFYAYPGKMLLTAAAIILLIFLMVYLNIRKKQLARELTEELKLNQSKNDFMSMMSHEIRTPLNAVIGYLRLARENMSEGTIVSEYVQKADKAAKQLVMIAKDMFDFNDIAHDELELETKVFELRSEINDVLSTVKLNMSNQPKSVRLDIDVSGVEYCYVKGDKRHIAQILFNLLMNTVKFTAAEGRIIFRLKTQRTENGIILKAVLGASGQQIPEQLLLYMRQPFKKSDFSYLSQFGAAGLTVYITRYITELLGGQLTSDDRVCILRLRLEEVTEEEILTVHKFSRLRALAALPSAEYDAVKALLKKLEVKCDRADDAAAVVKKLRSRVGGEYGYQLCFIDAAVYQAEPKLTELLREIDAKLIIIIVGEPAAQVKESGAAAAIDRPLNIGKLAAVIAAQLGEYRRTDEKAAAGQAISYAGIKALVVEDNETNAFILQQVLEKLGIKSEWFPDGESGSQRFIDSTAGEFQLILMDLQMPAMDGFAATRRIRASAHQQAASVPIIAVSANALRSDVEKALAAGMDEHLAKPLNVRHLTEILERYRNRWQ